MSIKSTTSLGFQCPHCGDIQQVEISIFDVSRFKSIEVKCQSCQKVFAKVKLANRECYEINALCIDCLDTHNYKIKRGELWLSKYRDFRCTQTNEPIFAIGKSEEVEKTILSMYDENEMMADGEFLDEEMLDSEMFEEFYEQLNQSPGFAQDGLARIMQEF
ncbi:MAG: hypothetical protein RSC29_04140, partial [Oscillospiraceae bacterium]